MKICIIKKVPLLVLTSLIIGLTIIGSCKKDPVIPTLTTNSITNLTINSSTSGGVISKDGGAAVTGRGVCWSTVENPDISGSFTTDSKGIGSFVSNITGLTPNTLYHVRAYATNSAGTAYGNDVSFTTTPVLVPALTTTAVSSIGLTTAVSGGTITSDGNAAITAKGVCWATTAAPTISNSVTTDGTESGSFISNLSGLLPGTIYFLRAYATNSEGTAYGNEVSFTTSQIVVPALTTTAATSVGLTTAVSGGNITADGGGAISAKGVCWATTANPTTTNSKTTDGTGTGSFISNLAGLLPATTYHTRAYATNSAGTAYGNDITFTTTPIVIATLTTTAVTSIGLTSAVSGGNIATDGGGTITARGVCWATTAAPTILNSKTTDGTGTGSFTSNLSGLLPATTYYVRSYATNSVGTAYGNEVSFTTSQVVIATLTTTTATSIGLTTAVSGGNITSNGGGTISARGVCWATTATPTISNFISSDGTGSGVFTSNLSGLVPATTYHVRAYATNSAGTAYGNDVSFTTSPVVVPTLTTAAATSIGLTTAVTGGNITTDGGGAVTTRGVCWATTATPTILNSKTTDGTGTGIFISSLSGLLPGTTYHVRAYATNSAGTAYGNEITFTTNSVIVPTLTTTTVSSITLTTAVSGGNITADGGAAVSARGVCWATTATPTILNSTTTNGTGTGIFISNLTGLVAGTTYYVRAYATNSAGTSYGNQISFRTLNETGTVTDIDFNTYNTVKIGTQWWMAQNLKTVLYNDNTAIPYEPDNSTWSLLTTDARCWYNNNEATYGPLYGAMYNWFAVNTGKLCPTGWHVPTDADFNILDMYLGISPADADLWGWRGTDQGAQLKSTTGWAGSGNGTNTSGFTALPGGYRYAADGSFNDVGNLTYWWSSTELDVTRAWYRRLDATNSGIYRAGTNKPGGKYVRCVKN